MASCRRCGRGVWFKAVAERLCRACYEDGVGASPERMAELKQMAEDGTLAGHCRRLLLRVAEGEI